jgi:hypothetical protein
VGFPEQLGCGNSSSDPGVVMKALRARVMESVISSEPEIVVNKEDERRLSSPGSEGWGRGIRQRDAKKYYMTSVDTHLSPPPPLLKDRIDAKWHDELPRVVKGEDGQRCMIVPGMKPERPSDAPLEGEDLVRSKSGADITGGARTSRWACNGSPSRIWTGSMVRSFSRRAVAAGVVISESRSRTV